MRISALVGLGLLCAGCADATRVYNVEQRPSYDVTEYGYAAGRRDLATIVRGDPFGMGEERFEDALVEALERHPPRPQPTNFTTEPGPSARPYYHAVFLFDAPPATGWTGLCQTPPQVPEVDTDGVVRLTAAFCRGQGVLTKATGEVAGVTGVDDPRFDALLGQVVIALVPVTDQDQDDDDHPILVPD